VSERLRSLVLELASEASRVRVKPPWDNHHHRAWRRIDEIIEGGLKTMRKAGVESPLTMLQECSFAMSFEQTVDENVGLHIVAVRLVNGRGMTEEYTSLKAMHAGKKTVDDALLSYYNASSVAEAGKAVSEELMSRGILVRRRS
jgi:hypothetical protein